MKLFELVEKYKGTAKFDVNAVADGENKDMIVFANDERNAVKDEIMNGEVLRYTVTKLVNTTPTISVVIKLEEKKDAENDENGSETVDDGNGAEE
ncbi:MAG: hypothetical protein NC413_04265 [Muribaculum sp.]|nr:hypothetical protein [Muribaculum sp.]